MRLRRLTIEGFKGVPGKFELELGGKSLLLLGENGHGKSTIVDALEFWSTGDVRAYHRDGYRLDALVNVNADRASVTCDGRGFATMRRTLDRGKVRANKPELAGPAATDAAPVTPLPILRHKTMAAFMDRSPTEKQAELLALLGLETLTTFRATLATVTNAAVRHAEEEERQLDAENAALRALHRDTGLVAEAERLRAAAGLNEPVTDEQVLRAIVVPDGNVQDTVARLAKVTAAEEALNALSATEVSAWNSLVGDRADAEQRGLAALLAAGRSVMAEWSEDRCPLCLTDRPRGELATEVAARASELADVERREADAKAALADHRARIVAAGKGIGDLLQEAAREKWPQEHALHEAKVLLGEHWKSVNAALESGVTSTPLPDLTAAGEALVGVRDQVGASVDDVGRRALAELVSLREQAKRVHEQSRRADAARRAARACEAFLGIAAIEVRQAVEASLASLSAIVADFYGRIVENPVFGGVELRYREDRGGGVEFALTYDHEHDVSPPQRVVSESQLNAFGLAIFLGRLKADVTQRWTMVVLDDVVNSFDANHRAGLARLIAEEFADWQVLLLTHDDVFGQYARRLLRRGWEAKQIVAWSPSGGPQLKAADPLDLLVQRLDDGEAAAGLGGLARVALEQCLREPVERLRFQIRYDSHGRWSAADYLQALRAGLKKARAEELRKLEVLDRVEASAGLINLVAHDRPTDQSPGASDLRRLAKDLEDLRGAFRCSTCGDSVWAVSADGGRHHECSCKALAV